MPKNDTGSAPHKLDHHNKLKIFKTLAHILLEIYHIQGPVDLLVLVLLLSRACLNLAIRTGDYLEVQVSNVRIADALRVKYELEHDVDALQASIRHYQQARGGQRYTFCVDAEAGLAYALFHRYMALGDVDDCWETRHVLDTAWTRVLPEDTAGMTYILTVLSLVRGAAATRSILPTASGDISQILANLRKIPVLTRPRSRLLLRLRAEARLLETMAFMTREPEYLREHGVLIDLALSLCSDTAEVLWWHILREMYGRHYTTIEFGQNSSDCRPLEQAINTANQLRCSAITGRNILIRSTAQCMWAIVAMAHALRCQEMDLMEHVVDVLKDTLFKCPPSLAMRKDWMTDFSWVLGTYFCHSGRVDALDQLVSLQDLGSDYLTKTQFLAANIAEGMLTRAQFSDAKTSKTLVNHALRLCQNRKDSANFAARELKELAAVDSQMITASQMQLRLGVPPLLTHEVIVDMAHGILSTLAALPEERVGAIMAQAEALVSLARIREDPVFLLKAEKVLEAELSNMVGSIFCIDLIAAQADVMVARWDLSHGADRHDLVEAWKTYSQALSHLGTFGRARERYQICLRWGKHAARRDCPSDAFVAYSSAIAILPRVVFMGEDVIGRLEALRQVSGLASSSIATALVLNDVSAAVQFLEQTRGIIWTQSIQTRMAHLSSVPDFLKKRLSDAITELENTESSFWTQRRHAAETLGTVISEIRGTPTFERFLLPPLLEEILGALKTTGGFSVIISPNATHCDVIMLGVPQGYSVHRIEAMSTTRIQQLAATFSIACSSARSSQEEELRSMKSVKPESKSMIRDSAFVDILSELWLSLIQPILYHMGLLNRPSHNMRRRLWWCPVGPLSSLPLHAAGIYGEGSEDDASAYIVSSYTPTLTALHHLITASPEGSVSAGINTRPKLLLVGQSSTDAGQLPVLPNTQLEIDCVRNTTASNVAILNSSNAQGMTVNDAVKSATEADILHLACHGHQDQDSPLDSGFELKDGRLRLSKLMRMTIPNAQLAYLSACESAGVDGSRPDEGLNLAGGMIFAGFKSVIATMWAMDDIDGPFMAERIYRRIFRDGGLDMSAVPYAVDDAVRELRESGVPASRWATYVHFGL